MSGWLLVIGAQINLGGLRRKQSRTQKNWRNLKMAIVAIINNETVKDGLQYLGDIVDVFW